MQTNLRGFDFFFHKLIFGSPYAVQIMNSRVEIQQQLQQQT